MKMNLIKMIIIAMLMSNSITAKSFTVGDTVYIWSNSGLNLRINPSFHSKIIAKIEPETILIVDEITNKKVIQNIFSQSDYEENPVSICGNWIKVKNDNQEGFVNDAFLSKLKIGDYPNLLKFLKSITVKSDTLTKQSPNCYTTQAYCKQGISYKSTCGELYGEMELTFNNWNLSKTLIFIDYYEKISTSINTGGKMKLLRNWESEIYLTNNMYSYKIIKYDKIIQVIITWSC